MLLLFVIKKEMMETRLCMIIKLRANSLACIYKDFAIVKINVCFRTQNPFRATINLAFNKYIKTIYRWIGNNHDFQELINYCFLLRFSNTIVACISPNHALRTFVPSSFIAMVQDRCPQFCMFLITQKTFTAFPWASVISYSPDVIGLQHVNINCY